MLKLTRLDQRVIALNPTHVVWVESTPDTMVLLLGGQKIIVRESIDEVTELFTSFYERVGYTPIVPPAAFSPDSSNEVEEK